MSTLEHSLEDLTSIRSHLQSGTLRKDVAIGGDPKFREMSHFLTSYSHQERALRASAFERAMEPQSPLLESQRVG